MDPRLERSHAARIRHEHGETMTAHTIIPGFWQTFATDCANKRNISGTVNITAGLARELIAGMDAAMLGSLTDETRRYLPAVLAELAELDAAITRNETAVRRRAILFGCATPKTGVDTSIHVAVSVAHHPAEYWRDRAAGERTLRNLPHPNTPGVPYSSPMPPRLARIYAAASHLLEDPSILNETVLEACWGIGPKVSRMCLAVAFPHARRFTIDLWHGRQMLACNGMDYRTNVGIDAAAYPALEAFWLQWADDNFPGVPTFAVQWACWNVCENRHRSHRRLWADI